VSSLRRGVVASGDNFSRQENIGNRRGEMFRQFQNSLSPQISEERNNIVNAAKNSNVLGPIIQGYEKIEPYLPDVDIGDKSIGYDYERPVGPGLLSIGGEYDFDDNEYGLDFGYKFSFDDGGIATLAGDLEQRMTPPDAQDVEPKRLTDEQKDYLMDYMLDFMFKQKQREQMENEGRVPPFNYFNMEV
jgi:hypothetical protein